jgi:hypothetical protein
MIFYGFQDHPRQPAAKYRPGGLEVLRVLVVYLRRLLQHKTLHQDGCILGIDMG